MFTCGLPISSFPVLLHRCLRCLHCLSLHPHRLVLAVSRNPGPREHTAGGRMGVPCSFQERVSSRSADRLSAGRSQRAMVGVEGCLGEGTTSGAGVFPSRTPDWAGSLPFFLQLHGLPRCVCSPGASAEKAPAGRLCPGCGPLLASAPAPHGPQALWQPSSLCAFGAGRRLRSTPLLLTRALVPLL